MRTEILVFTKTAGYRHDSIPAGARAVRELAAGRGFEVTATEDEAVFHPDRLAGVAVVVFLNTSGNLLADGQRSAFEAYVRGGGGFVGVHGAADTCYDWPFYGAVVGAYFSDHPPEIQRATVVVADRGHPATAHLDPCWVREDEWYNFRTPVRGDARVLLRLDASSYEGSTMGADHPHAWCAEVAGGRSFYTAGGHTVEAYDEPAFRAHLLGGLTWAAGEG
ncbi:ThuA domain-containing protein [Micromonospora sp. WMMD882]|uniref:ThuA domain-containing protein n=1 Tax=Micromonospora sp. WMMD882 TaxID=3015151 RepID=UPI00248BCBED|nr:ThuA domain-containing protein [Micromonospora sp. WMMD882]WBB80621.1 ThuA domain-containing protein [Micromonospora sp. WMMD882]